MRSLEEDALKLEGLLPQLMRVLIPMVDCDPLGGIPLGQLRLIRSLEHGPRTAGEVGAELGLSPSSLSQMVARLEEVGLLHREGDPEDRRHRRLRLTDEATRRLAERSHLRARQAETALAKLTPTDRAALLSAIEKMVADEPGVGPLTSVGEVSRGTPF